MIAFPAALIPLEPVRRIRNGRHLQLALGIGTGRPVMLLFVNGLAARAVG